MHRHRNAFGLREIGDHSRKLMELRSPTVEIEGPLNAEGLVERIGRAKARWLRRVMYETAASSTQKCFAYAIADHLNCVTLDSWPGQLRLAKLLDLKSAKTLQRAARGLERLGVLTLKGGGRSGYRYAPVFLPTDEDKIILAAGYSRPAVADKNVRESLLVIQPKSSDSTEVAARKGTLQEYGTSYQPRQRGAIELKLAEMLGSNGMEVLGKLGELDDAIVERLCRAYSAGALGERELIAARLAAEQVR
jgi:hypothetical protein